MAPSVRGCLSSPQPSVFLVYLLRPTLQLKSVFSVYLSIRATGPFSSVCRLFELFFQREVGGGGWVKSSQFILSSLVTHMWEMAVAANKQTNNAPPQENPQYKPKLKNKIKICPLIPKKLTGTDCKKAECGVQPLTQKDLTPAHPACSPRGRLRGLADCFGVFPFWKPQSGKTPDFRGKTNQGSTRKAV